MRLLTTGWKFSVISNRVSLFPNTKVYSFLGMKEIADRPCGTYSGGNKRKLNTCMSMIGLPSLIILDEATTGVDPPSRRELLSIIKDIKHKGTSGLIVASHSVNECEELCDR